MRERERERRAFVAYTARVAHVMLRQRLRIQDEGIKHQRSKLHASTITKRRKKISEFGMNE